MQMNKSAEFLSAVVAAVTLAVGFTLAGCAKDCRAPQDGKLENGHSIVYAFTAEEGKVASGGSMLDYMNALKISGDLIFEESNGFVISVFGVTGKTVSSAANAYSGWDWTVYTTVTTEDGVTYSGTENFDYCGLKFYKASYGVAGIPCIAGESYALVYEFSSMIW